MDFRRILKTGLFGGRFVLCYKVLKYKDKLAKIEKVTQERRVDKLWISGGL